MSPIERPLHCAWCGAYLMGGATQHAADCWVTIFSAATGRAIASLEAQAAKWMALAECECRTCGHKATSHIGGHCFECGRAECWS